MPTALRWTQAEINEQHHVTQKIGDGLKKVGADLQQWDAKHDVSGKVAAGWTNGMNALTNALGKK